MLIRTAQALFGTALLLFGATSAHASVTADLTVSLRAWQTDRLDAIRVGYFRLLADADVSRAARFHLDLDRDEGTGVEPYEAFGEWGAAGQRGRLGRFELPFGIHSRTELYYVGLINDPLVRYYPFQGPRIQRSETGVGYLGAFGPWQVEAALFGHGGTIRALVPSGGQGSIRVQRFSGPIIIGVSALRERYRDEGGRYDDTGRIFGLDFRFSRPTLILRGELVSGKVPGGSPRGFYVDALYHPAALGRVTFVARTEAVSGQPMNGRRYERQTVGFKWSLGQGTSLAVNQVFDSPRTSFGNNGTSLFLWHTRRL